MFHTFQAASAPAPDSDQPGAARQKEGSSRRISTSNACLECRRRKIRCDGALPCSQCQWYHHPEACRYTKPTQRVVPSRALVEKLVTRNNQTETIFSRLFPGRHVDALVSLSREELLNLALLPANSPPSSTQSSGAKQASISDTTTAASDAAHSLEALEQVPDPEGGNDEIQRHLDTKVQRVSDDVNGLSLTVDKQSSYVGVSSITAALKVIFKLSPGARVYLARYRPLETALPSRVNTPPPFEAELDATALPPLNEARKILEAYFLRIHTLMPMVDEAKVWRIWQQGNRQDAPWLALLNTIFALGSLACGNADKDDHTVFFKRAMYHIDIELLGSSNIMAVQAIGLMGGYYLHYVNRPNLANNLLGAALRMATVLGMHRDFAQPQDSASGHVPATTMERPIDSADRNPSEIRRRTWWSLVTLDTWAMVTNGRPSLGRLGPGVTVRPPRVAQEKRGPDRYQEALKMLPIIHNTTFAKILTRIQDLLAVSHTLEFEDMLSLDAELVSWHDDLPTVLLPQYIRPVPQCPEVAKRRTSSMASKRPHIQAPVGSESPFDFSAPMERTRSMTDTCPPFLRTARLVMHFKYQNLRVVLHRPAVLAAALRQIPFHALSAEEKVAVDRCRVVAAQTIADIGGMCEEEPVAAWNGVWYMYQAVMVPLVSLFANLSRSAIKTKRAKVKTERCDDAGSQPSPPSATGDSEIYKWRAQIETAIAFFQRMEHWSVTAKKSRDVVSRLYDAAEHFHQHNEAQRQHLHAAQLSPTPHDPAQARRDYHAQVLAHHRGPAFGPGIDAAALSVPPAQHVNYVTAFPHPQPSLAPPFAADVILPLPPPRFSDAPWALPTPHPDARLENVWLDMAWDSAPAFDDDGGGFGLGGDGAMGIPGGVAVDVAMGEEYFGAMQGHQHHHAHVVSSGRNGVHGLAHCGPREQVQHVPQEQAGGVAGWDYGYTHLEGGRVTG